MVQVAPAVQDEALAISQSRSPSDTDANNERSFDMVRAELSELTADLAAAEADAEARDEQARNVETSLRAELNKARQDANGAREQAMAADLALQAANTALEISKAEAAAALETAKSASEEAAELRRQASIACDEASAQARASSAARAESAAAVQAAKSVTEEMAVLRRQTSIALEETSTQARAAAAAKAENAQLKTSLATAHDERRKCVEEVEKLRRQLEDAEAINHARSTCRDGENQGDVDLERENRTLVRRLIRSERRVALLEEKLGDDAPPATPDTAYGDSPSSAVVLTPGNATMTPGATTPAPQRMQTPRRTSPDAAWTESARKRVMELESELSAANEALQDSMQQVHALERGNVTMHASKSPLSPGNSGWSDRAARVGAALAEAQEREQVLARERDGACAALMQSEERRKEAEQTYRAHSRKFQMELGSAKKKVLALELAHKRLSQNLASSAAEASALRKESGKLREEVAALKQKASEVPVLSSRIESLERERATMQTCNDNLWRQLQESDARSRKIMEDSMSAASLRANEAQSKLDSLRESLEAKMADSTAAFARERASLTTEISAQSTALAAVQTRVSEAENASAQAQSAMDIERRATEAAEKRVSELEGQIAAHTESASRDVAQLKAQHEKYLASVNQRLSEITMQRADDADSAAAQLREASDRISELEEQLAETMRMRDGTARELADLRAAAATTTEERSAAMAELQEVREELDAAEQEIRELQSRVAPTAHDASAEEYATTSSTRPKPSSNDGDRSKHTTARKRERRTLPKSSTRTTKNEKSTASAEAELALAMSVLATRRAEEAVLRLQVASNGELGIDPNSETSPASSPDSNATPSKRARVDMRHALKLTIPSSPSPEDEDEAGPPSLSFDPLGNSSSADGTSFSGSDVMEPPTPTLGVPENPVHSSHEDNTGARVQRNFVRTMNRVRREEVVARQACKFANQLMADLTRQRRRLDASLKAASPGRTSATLAKQSARIKEELDRTQAQRDAVRRRISSLRAFEAASAAATAAGENVPRSPRGGWVVSRDGAVDAEVAGPTALSLVCAASACKDATDAARALGTQDPLLEYRSRKVLAPVNDQHVSQRIPSTKARAAALAGTSPREGSFHKHDAFVERMLDQLTTARSVVKHSRYQPR